MISVLMGDPRQVKNVFSCDIQTALEKEAGLEKAIVIQAGNLDQYRDVTQSAEYIFGTWGMPNLTEAQIETYFPALKAIFYAAGSVQHFSRPYMARGVKIYSAWAANAVPVAEFTLAQIFLANKGAFQNMLAQSCGNLERAAALRCAFQGNFNSRVGIIGAGMIGGMVIDLLKHHEIEVVVFDPFLSDERAASLGVLKVSLEEMFETCHTVSNHLANNEKTVGMLNYALFSRMKPNASFINTGRGAQVVEADLVRALREAPDRTALLDVTEPEPPAPDHPFYQMDNVFLTSHIAGSSGGEVVRMAKYMLDEFRLYAAGEKARYEVTLAQLATMA